MDAHSKSETPAIEPTFNPPTPEYYAAWEKCRELASQLSQALAATGDNEFAYIRPAGGLHMICFGALEPSAVDRVILAHQAACKEEEPGREMDKEHRELFEVLKKTKPATIYEAQIKIRYIADHLETMDEAMDEETAIALLRTLV